MIKASIDKFIEENSLELMEIGDKIFDRPEMAFEEHYASEILTDYLSKNGYLVEKGIGGLETAFRATYEQGEGGVSIGLLCEYDALEIGHACGHHLQGPIILLVAQAIKSLGLKEAFRLVIYGTPAEEGRQGKYRMLEGGCFSDIDLALMTHASPYTTVDVKSLAGDSLEVVFSGIQAHESLTPELSRSAVDGMILALQGIEFLRGHVKEDVKFFSMINDCNGVPSNQDPNIAKCTITIRTYSDEDLPSLQERVVDVVRGAALMTGTKVDYKFVRRTDGKLPSLSLNKIIMDNAKSLEAPSILEFRERTGSTDFGRLTQMIPGAVSRFKLVPENVTTHSMEFLDYGKGKEAYDGLVMGSKILAYTVFDLIKDSDLFEEVKGEFEERKLNLERSKS